MPPCRAPDRRGARRRAVAGKRALEGDARYKCAEAGDICR